MLQPRFFIQKRSGLPVFRINPDLDNYFFPFFPAAGIAAKELNNNLTYDSLQWEKIFTGKNTIIMKWVGSEKPLTAFDLTTQKTVLDPDLYTKNLVFNKNIKVGNFYVGKILNHSQAVSFVKKSFFLKQKININLNVYFRNNLVWDETNQQVRQENLYLFWKIPESSPTDLFYIANCQIFLTLQGRYLCHVINFASVGEKLNEIGIYLDQRVQFAAPGESPILPEVKMKLDWISDRPPVENDLIFFDEFKKDSNNKLVFEKRKNSKQPYINSFLFNKTQGIKSIQLEFEGLIGLIAFNIYGYKKNENKLVVNRTIDIFPHKNIGVQISGLQKSRQFNDEFLILGGFSAMQRFWFANWKKDIGLSVGPNTKRDEQGVIEHINKTWADILTATKKNSVLSAQQNAGQPSTLSGVRNMALNPFTFLFSEKLQWDDTLNVISPPDEINLDLNLTEFLNLNRYLNFNTEILELGLYQLKNNKGLITAIMNDTFKFLGIATSIFGFGGRKLTSGLSALNQVVNTTMSWLPDELFTKKKILKIPATFNFAISKEFCEFIAASLPNYSSGLVNPAYIPFDFFKETAWNPWAGLIGTHNLNQSVNFEITNILDFVTSSGELARSASAELVTGLKKIPTGKFKTYSSNDDFVIQMLEIKVVGFRNCVITFRDKKNKLTNYFKIQTQNKFSGNAKAVTTRIWTDWTRDNNISLDEKFKNSFASDVELHNYSEAHIVSAKNTDEFEDRLFESLDDAFFFPNKNGLLIEKNNHKSGVDIHISLSPITLILKNIFISLKDKSDFWTIFGNALNTRPVALLNKIFSKLTFSLKFSVREIGSEWRPAVSPNQFYFNDSWPRVPMVKMNNLWKHESGPTWIGDGWYRTTFFQIKDYPRQINSFEMENHFENVNIWDSNFEIVKNWTPKTAWFRKKAGVRRTQRIESKEVLDTGILGKQVRWTDNYWYEYPVLPVNNYFYRISYDLNTNLFFDEIKKELRLEIIFLNAIFFTNKNLERAFKNMKIEIQAEIYDAKLSN